MHVHFSCVNMNHSLYLQNYAENRLNEKAFLLVNPPLDTYLTIEATLAQRIVVCEVLTIDSASFYIEYNGSDIHNLIDLVIDRLVEQLNHHESKIKSYGKVGLENVVALSAYRARRQS